MPDIPRYLVDGLLSASTHNGVHRLMLYTLSGTESPEAVAQVELLIPDQSMPSIVEDIDEMLNAPAPNARFLSRQS